ncbi:MAG: NAD-dependent deacylase [Anaerolineae bacterium]|jgi:NAD-dependent deacetylase|nr:NAD-dependent deacylase [Anaerolineae bacterium]MBT7073179.1 NAD-dependent deacylase [Anaerolineae bacterium]MBT7324084.1 NAD-dependent deacylase [Anaerolineae bacterium]
MSRLASQAIKKIDFAADLFRQAKHAVVLTGAGVSTPSGIPDFRSEGTGLWSKSEAMEVASLSTFRYDPSKFYNWFRPLASKIINAAPNSAHTTLAEMGKAGYLKTVITQNIDVLHQKAGSKNVIEMHGTLRTLSCTQCFKQFESAPYLEIFVEAGALPHCPDCSAILKPDVILFGEQLPQKAWLKAQEAARHCDLMLIVGSSLEVLPVAGLPMQTLERGGHLIIINQIPTYLNVRADIVFTEDASTLLPLLAEEILNHG